jgi:hypothetical protein
VSPPDSSLDDPSFHPWLPPEPAPTCTTSGRESFRSLIQMSDELVDRHVIDRRTHAPGQFAVGSTTLLELTGQLMEAVVETTALLDVVR